MTAAEVAKHYRTAESTVRYWKHIGKLRGVRMGRRLLFSVEEIRANDEKLSGK